MARRMHEFEARASILIAAGPVVVWRALVDPAEIKDYMFGATVESDWVEGGPIVWRGERQGAPYEDKGEILRLEPGRLLRYSHFSPLSGLPDEPENYHTVTVALTPDPRGTLVTLAQDRIFTRDARDHAAGNWRTMLAALKDHVERRGQKAA
jgi:uncharacterized protein YndB with AHSA1/START domain